MQEMYVKLQKNLGLSLILFIGLSVEFSNFQSLFFRFMSQYRADWGAINHIPAMFLSAFLLLCIVIFGIRKQALLSWFLAMLTCVISFAVYSRMNLSWRWENMTEVHFVVLILSGMLPLLVAYTTHQITQDEQDYYEHYGHLPAAKHDRAEVERLMKEIRKMKALLEAQKTHVRNAQENTQEDMYWQTQQEQNFGQTRAQTHAQNSYKNSANSQKQQVNYQSNSQTKQENNQTLYEKKKTITV